MSFKIIIAVGLMCFSGFALAEQHPANIQCDSPAQHVPTRKENVRDIKISGNGNVVSYIDKNGKAHDLVGYSCAIDYEKGDSE